MGLINALRALAALSWFAIFAVVGVTIFRAARNQSTKKTVPLLIFVIVLAVVLNIVSAGLVFVDNGDLGVVVSALERKGYKDDPLPSGLHWIVPFAEHVETYSIASQTYTMSIASDEGNLVGDDSVESRTSDGQVIRIDASVIFRINPEHVIDDIHIKWQRGQYVQLLVRPQVRGVIRDMVSQYAVEEVYSIKRDELISQISEELTQIFTDNGLILEDFVLRNIAFSDEYNIVLERKQIQEQEILVNEFVVEQRKQEAEQARQQAQGVADAQVIQAQGEADALRIQAQAEADATLIRAQAEAEALLLLGQAIDANPDVLTLQYIDQLSPNIRVMLLPSDNPFLLPLPEDAIP